MKASRFVLSLSAAALCLGVTFAPAFAEDYSDKQPAAAKMSSDKMGKTDNMGKMDDMGKSAKKTKTTSKKKTDGMSDKMMDKKPDGMQKY
ncbi:MAG: hypothetical protein QOF19_640 [Alphaproteobacteria bacterium]|jgi:hypothetical protein|nr:hypothetical protein [Alphaproteobacteria bacterium]